MERLQQDNYILLRIGIERLWLEDLKLPGCLKMFEAQEPKPDEVEQESSKVKRRKGYFQRRREKKRQLELARQLEIQLENARMELLQKVEELWLLLSPMVDFPGESYVVFEEVLKRKAFPLLWQKVCHFPEFEGYIQERWAELLLPYATHSDYLILGKSRLLQDFLWSRGVRMKTLKWILPKHLYTEDVKQFEEDFLYEFGLAIDVQILQSEQEYRRISLMSRGPVTVIDFSGAERLHMMGVQAESIWLDMSSSEEKQRRIEGANPSISYISLKKQWKQAKKDSIFLDTISKNRYNT